MIKDVPFFDKVLDVQLDKINITEKPKRFMVIDTSNYSAKISILPRTPDPIYIPPKLKKVKRVWTFPISIWAKDFKFETEEFLRKCFEKDWTCAKIIKVAKNPEEFEQIKEILWKNYK